jgi:hypothetical protein
MGSNIFQSLWPFSIPSNARAGISTLCQALRRVFPNTVPFSESFGWVADFKKPDDFDYLYFETAHELAHQMVGPPGKPQTIPGFQPDFRSIGGIYAPCC